MTGKLFILPFLPQFAREYLDHIEASPIGSRLAQGTFWSLVGALAGRLLSLPASIVVARMLGKSEFGTLGMITTTIGMFQMFAGFQLGMTGLKFVAEYKKKDPVKTARIISLSYIIAIASGALIAVILVTFSNWIASRILGSPDLANLLRISSLMVLIGAINGVQTGVLSGFESFKVLANINLIVGVVTLPITVGGIYFAGVAGAVWSMVLMTVLNAILNNISLRREMHHHGISRTFSGCFKESQVLWSFSMPALLASLMSVPINWICSAILVNQKDGYSEMGIFSAANQWFGALLFLPQNAGQIVLPLLSERFGVSDSKSSIKILKLSMTVNGVLLFPLLLIICMMSPFIMGSYGENFRDGWVILIVVSLTAGLLGIQMPVGHVIGASGKMWLGFYMNLGWAVIFILSTIWFVHLGALGLAFARLISYCFHALWTFGWAYYFINRVNI